MWDSTTWEPVRNFTGTDQYLVAAAAFTNDGKSMLGAHGSIWVSTNYDVQPYIIRWDVETGEELQRYMFPEQVPNQGGINVEVHPTQDVAVVTVYEQFSEHTEGASWAAYVLNLETGEYRRVHEDLFIAQAKYTADGQYLVAIKMYDNEIYVMSTDTYEIIRQWQAIDSQIMGVAVSDDNRFIATGSAAQAFENKVSLWNFETGELIRRYSGHDTQSFIWTIDIHPNSQQIAVNGYERQVLIWDADLQSSHSWLTENRVIRTFTCPEREQYRIEPLCDG